MDLYPAIDLRGGQVVRLEKGDYDRQTVYGNSPETVAGGFVSDGAGWIHVVDLDAAISGELTNTEALRSILRTASDAGVKIQNGGGIRTTERIRMLLTEGIDRLVIGSAALKDWPWFEGVLDDESIPNDRLALGLDTRDGRVAAQGWTEQLEMRATEIAQNVRGSGLGAIVHTDISRDGMLQGVNIEETASVVAATDVPVIASGGVSSIDDVLRAKEIGCAGIILGKALYEGRVNLKDAIEAAGRI